MVNKIDIIILGSSSGQPSKTRNQSALAVILDDKETWIFDCGEGTQRQIIQSDNIEFINITKIFITHMHGDHVLGLPGLLSTMGRYLTDGIIEIYGPTGIRKFLKETLTLTHANLSFRYNVFELECESDKDNFLENELALIFGSRLYLNEFKCKAISKNEIAYEDEHIYIKACQIMHTIPSFGYVICEKPKLAPIEENDFSKFDNIKGRKIVILGDTCDPINIAIDAMDADILIHESTNIVKDHCIEHGHSTPEMAGKFAKSINAKILVLTHFNSIFADEESSSEKNPSKIAQLVKSAKSEFNGEILTASDFMKIQVLI